MVLDFYKVRIYIYTCMYIFVLYILDGEITDNKSVNSCQEKNKIYMMKSLTK
jgi:hypothetical protein